MTSMPMESFPDQTVNRLPIYLRCLLQARVIGMQVVNSLQLGQMAGTNAAQVRKDLSYLGELGTRGLGYDVAALIVHVSTVLGLERVRRVAIVGFGRLGAALVGYPGFADRGFEIVGVFDADPAKVGQVVERADFAPDGLTVMSIVHIESDLREVDAEIAVLTTSPEAAVAMADRIAAAGVRAILNFTPVQLELPPTVRVSQVDLSVELQVLSFYLARTD